MHRSRRSGRRWSGRRGAGASRPASRIASWRARTTGASPRARSAGEAPWPGRSKAIACRLEGSACSDIVLRWSTPLDPELVSGFRDGQRDALSSLHGRVGRLEAAGALGGRAVPDAAREFHALCEGVAGMELRSLLPTGEEERIWRDALTTLVRRLRRSASVKIA